MMSKISTRMIAALTALFMCTAALAYLAWGAMAHQSAALQMTYADAVVPLRNLKIISDRYAVDIVDAAHKTRNGNFTPEQSLTAMKTALAEIDKLWTEFHAQPHAGAEAELAKKAETHLAKARKATLTLIELVERKDIDAIARFTIKDMYPAIDPGTEAIGELIELQLAQAKEIALAAFEADSRARLTLIGVIAFGLLVWGLAAFYTVFGVVRPLNRSVETMEHLAEAITGTGGDGATRLANLSAITVDGTGRKDEIGDMARTLLTFKENGLEGQRLRAELEQDQAGREQRAVQIEALISDFEHSSMKVVTSVATTSAQLEASDRKSVV